MKLGNQGQAGTCKVELKATRMDQYLCETLCFEASNFGDEHVVQEELVALHHRAKHIPAPEAGNLARAIGAVSPAVRSPNQKSQQEATLGCRAQTSEDKAKYLLLYLIFQSSHEPLPVAHANVELCSEGK